MSRTVRSRITYANVMSTLAVFIALGGGAWAVSGRQAAPTERRATAAPAATRPGGPPARVATQAGTSDSTNPSNDIVRSCVDNRTGAVRIIASGQRCSGREHHFFWVSFNGHFKSNHDNASLDITDSGIVLTRNVPGLPLQTITLDGGGMHVDTQQIHLTPVHNLSLDVGKDMTTTVDGDQTTTVHKDRTTTVDGNETTTIHKNRTTTIDQNETTSVHGNRSSTVDKSQTETVGINRALTVGATNEVTVGSAMSEAIGGSFTTSIGGNQNVTITGNSNTKAVGGTLDTTAGTIKNNADVIQNLSDGALLNSAGTNLTNHADQALTNSAGAGLTNQAGNTLTDTASKDLVLNSGLDLKAKAPGQAILTSPIVHLGCAGGQFAARQGDSVNTASNPGSITGGSLVVRIC